MFTTQATSLSFAFIVKITARYSSTIPLSGLFQPKDEVISKKKLYLETFNMCQRFAVIATPICTWRNMWLDGLNMLDPK